MTNAVVDVGSEYDTVAICKYMNIVKGVEALPAVKTSFIFNRIYVLCVKKKTTTTAMTDTEEMGPVFTEPAPPSLLGSLYITVGFCDAGLESKKNSVLTNYFLSESEIIFYLRISKYFLL